jgi:exonuclease III
VDSGTITKLSEGQGPREPDRLILSSWNLEGLTDIKVHEVATYMEAHSIDVMCIQEVRKLKSDKFCSECGHLWLLSGSGSGSREWAGVGSVLASRLQDQFIGFRPISNRVAVLKFSVAGGSSALCSVLAPHNLRPHPERVAFYDEFSETLRPPG